MKDLVSQMNAWQLSKKTFALARVINTWGSSPRPVGSGMLISDRAEMTGSVSGGCVEGAVLKEAKLAMESRRGKKLDYGVSDDEAWSVGLTCGGKIQVYVQPFPTDNSPDQLGVWNSLIQLITENKTCALVTELSDGTTGNALITAGGKEKGTQFAGEVFGQAQEALGKGISTTVTHGEKEYFIHVFPRKNQLLMIGAAHITVSLVELAKGFDFETIVIDPRGTFSKMTQFEVPPDRIIEKYPSEVLDEFELDSHTYVVILSHDPKIDDDALLRLLRSKVNYIGALGSRKTHEKRVARLQQQGFTVQEIGRINAPIGMDIRAQGAREIALSILGEIIKRKNDT